MTDHPKTVDDIFEDFRGRRAGLLRALSDDMEDFYQQCDPERENLCLYGDRDGSWNVDLPSEEVPPELPEPCLGINFARDGMQKRDWIALVAVHSDSWLYAVSFYYGAKLDQTDRLKLFKNINQYPTLFEVVSERFREKGNNIMPNKRKKTNYNSGAGTAAGGVGGLVGAQQHLIARCSWSPMPNGKLLTVEDISPDIIDREAELFWPDDKKWYLVRVQSVDSKEKTAKVTYTSGEVEHLKLIEIIREGHMSLIPRGEG